RCALAIGPIFPLATVRLIRSAGRRPGRAGRPCHLFFRHALRAFGIRPREKTVRIVWAGICLSLLLVGCGRQVPQNKLALLVKTLGERSSSNATASADIYWARRLPLGVNLNPGIRIFTFPLGLQEYEFSQLPSYESPRDEAIEVDCLGGHLKFDVNIQLFLDKEMPNLADKLLQFINDHQLQSYSGE